MKNFKRKFLLWWSIQRIGLFLLFFSITIAGIGYLNQHMGFTFGESMNKLIQDFYANFATELFSLSITILIVDQLYENRATAEEKKRLILQMGSPDNSFAIEAVRQLRVKGWLFDGSLSGNDLRGARLDKADLSFADLRNTNLIRANLTETDVQNANFENARLSGANFSKALICMVNFSGARLNHTNFEGATILDVDFRDTEIKFSNFSNTYGPTNVDSRLNSNPLLVAHSLRGTLLHGGKKYSGEYDLQGDINDARVIYKIDVNDADAMDKFYREAREEIEIVVPGENHKTWIDVRK